MNTKLMGAVAAVLLLSWIAFEALWAPNDLTPAIRPAVWLAGFLLAVAGWLGYDEPEGRTVD
jgi:hypothetical protein